MLIIYWKDHNQTSDGLFATESALCVYISCVLVCIFVMLAGFRTSLCLWGCNLSSHPLSPWKTGKLKILLCISKTHFLTHTHTLYIYIHRMQRNSRPHTNTSQSLSLCSLPQPDCAEDTSYLTTLPSPDTSPHKCACIATHTQTHTHSHTHFTAFYPPNSPTLYGICDHVEQRQLHIQGHILFTQCQRSRFLGKSLSISVLFHAGNIAFIKRPLC